MTNTTKVRFMCPICSKDSTDIIPISDDYWRTNDYNATQTSDVICQHCETTFAASIVNSDQECAISFDYYPNAPIEADFVQDRALWESEEDDEWLDYNTPDEPHHIFNDSSSQLISFLKIHGGNTDASFINKMVFTQLWSTFEAYLCDTLVNHIFADHDALQNLLDHDKTMQNEKIKLADVLRNPHLVNEKAKKYLKEILYHNLERVDFLYRNCLEVSIFDQQENKENLLRAVVFRHDCVHRNGRDKEGNELSGFTEIYVRETADMMQNLVNTIEVELQSK